VLTLSPYSRCCAWLCSSVPSAARRGGGVGRSGWEAGVLIEPESWIALD
jgi:hypothetical protein